jgi:hypothetical protein
MVTGYGNVELAEQAMQLGADQYLSKPFHNKDLLDVLQQIFQKRGIPLPVPPSQAPEPAAGAPPAETPVAESAPDEEVERDRRPLAAAILALLVLGGAGTLWWTSRPRQDYAVPYSNPASIVFHGGLLWTADWFSQAIYVHEVRKRDLPLKQTYYLPDIHLTGMAVLDDAIYTADSWAHVLRKHRLDENLSVIFSVPSPGSSPCSLFWDGKYLWSCDLTTGKIYQHQADNRLTVVASYSSPGNSPVGFFKDDRFGWSLDAKNRRLYERRLDSQLSLLSVYELPEWEEGSAPLACFTWRGSELWFTRTGENLIHRRAKSQLRRIKD